MKHNLSVGQTVYVKPIRNRFSKDNIYDEVIKSIGNKYFYLEKAYYGRFEIKSMYQDGRGYGSDYRIYLSMQEIDDEKERDSIVQGLRKLFDFGHPVNLALDQLRRIMEIVRE